MKPLGLLHRLALLVLLLNSLLVGLWAQFAPDSFYHSFPGLGWVWVGVDGPYNEHLLRDVGGLNLALAVLLGLAWLEPSPSLLRAAALATLAYQIPHNLYHLEHLSLIEGSVSQTAQTIGLLLGIGASLLLLRRR